jgi:hypothetical protein
MADVFVFEVEDADSEGRQAAYRRLRDLGLHKKQIQNEGRPVRTESVADWEILSEKPDAVLRRQGDHDGWGAWEPVPEGLSLDWRVSGQARRVHPRR